MLLDAHAVENIERATLAAVSPEAAEATALSSPRW
jgi:hypothetical protein